MKTFLPGLHLTGCARFRLYHFEISGLGPGAEISVICLDFICCSKDLTPSPA